MTLLLEAIALVAICVAGGVTGFLVACVARPAAQMHGEVPRSRHEHRGQR